jgi:hypothetical protein
MPRSRLLRILPILWRRSFPTEQAVFFWHARCNAASMSDAYNGFLFLLIAAGLGVCFVWAFWEMEQSRERRRQRRAAVGRQPTWKR